MRRCAAGWKVGGGSWYRYLSIRVGCGVEWCGGILCILWGWRGKYTCARLLAGTILFRPTYERTLFNPQPGAFRFGPITTVESLRLDCNYGFGRNSDLGLYMSSLALQQAVRDTTKGGNQRLLEESARRYVLFEGTQLHS